MATLDSLFEQFLRERRYLKNVSARTCEWYDTAWKTFLKTQPAGLATTDITSPLVLTRQHLSSFVVTLRDRGVRPVTCNTWLRALNAYCRWLGAEGVLREGVRLAPMRLEKRFVPTLDERALRALLAFKPVGFPQSRVQTAVTTILDTGCRIAEILSARVRDFDLDNLLLTVVGKGDKQRIVPFGFELRKRLFRFAQLKKKLGSVASGCSGAATAACGNTATRSAATTCCSNGSACRSPGSTSCGTRSRPST